MSNDEDFNFEIKSPKHEIGKGPRVVIDGSHHNFFTVTDLIQPLIDVLNSDGYSVSVSNKKFKEQSISNVDIIVIATPMAKSYKHFFQKYKGAFRKKELIVLNNWVKKGGSILMFSEHFPFDTAIEPLLNSFNIETSIGETLDSEHSKEGPIVFTNERLEFNHPIISGKRKVKSVATYGGSALKGNNYTNLMKLSNNARNVERSWMFAKKGPIGNGYSQGLAGSFGKGKVVAFGDANGFVAMVFSEAEGIKLKAGMNDDKYDWKNFVLNTFDWLSN